MTDDPIRYEVLSVEGHLFEVEKKVWDVVPASHKRKTANLEAALRDVLTDDGNCTENEPQDSSCPRCRARKVLASAQPVRR